jgi:3D (Asp-Asp-Asp) domain-containing protein
MEVVLRVTFFTLLCAVVLALACSLVAAAAAATSDGKRIELRLADEVIPLSSKATTVEAFLRELSIDPHSGIAIDPALDAALTDGMSIHLPGLTVTRGVTERAIPAEIQFVERKTAGADSFAVDEPGCDGLLRSTCTIFFAEGKEVGRRQREEVVRPMRAKVVINYKHVEGWDAIPSVEQILEERLAPGTVTEPPLIYEKVMTMSASAYEPGPTSCGPGCSGRTSIGLKAGYGVVAIDPRVIPYGTRLFIEGYGYAVAGDTGGAIKGKRIDLGFLTVRECLDFGRQKVKVYVID